MAPPDPRERPSAPLPVLGFIPSVWTAPESQPVILSYAELPLPKDRLFFVAPPKEIGEIKTADSTLKVGQKPASFGRRILTAIFIGVAVGAGSFLLTFFTQPPGFCFLVGIVAGLFGFSLGKEKHQCSYVGTEGIALYTFGNVTGYVREEKVLLFKEATEYRIDCPPSIKSFPATKSYDFYWKNDSGRILFSVQDGTEHEKLLLASAGMAWCTYLLPSAREQLHEGKSIRFPTIDGFVLLSREVLELHAPDRTAISPVNTLKNYTIQKGVLTLTGSKDTFAFSFTGFSNFRLFTTLLKDLLRSSRTLL